MTLAVTEANNILAAQNGGAWVAPTAQLASLSTGDPGTGDSPASEASGGSYARQTVAWTTPASKSCSNTGRMDFAGMAAGTYTYASRLGTYGGTTRQQSNGQLTTPVITLTGQTISFLAGSLATTCT